MKDVFDQVIKSRGLIENAKDCSAKMVEAFANLDSCLDKLELALQKIEESFSVSGESIYMDPETMKSFKIEKAIIEVSIKPKSYREFSKNSGNMQREDEEE